MWSKNSHCEILTYPTGFVSSVNQHHLLVCFLHDVKDILQVYELSTGQLVMDLPLDVGTVCGVSCKKKHSDFFYKFSSFTTPGRSFLLTRFILALNWYKPDAKRINSRHVSFFHIDVFKCVYLMFGNLRYRHSSGTTEWNADAWGMATKEYFKMLCVFIEFVSHIVAGDTLFVWWTLLFLLHWLTCKEGVMAEKREKDTHLLANLIQNIVKFFFYHLRMNLLLNTLRCLMFGTTFVASTHPGIIYHCDLSKAKPQPTVFREVEVKGIKQEDYQTHQVTSFPFTSFFCSFPLILHFKQ